MSSSEPEPICPSCGYIRVGIEHDARCPECGADGFADAFVIQGNATRPVMSLITIIPILVFVGLLVAVRLSVVISRGALTFDIIPLVAALVVLAVLAYRSLRSSREATNMMSRSIGIWQFTPGGVIVRERGRNRHLPTDAVARIDCVDSLIAPVSRLMIVTRPFVKESLATTSILYVHGTREQRRAQWRRAREVLGLWSPSNSGR